MVAADGETGRAYENKNVFFSLRKRRNELLNVRGVAIRSRNVVVRLERDA